MARASVSGEVDRVEYQQGYEAVFHPPLDRKYVCPICLAALREAVQTTCGHRFCSDCIMALTSSNMVKCPVDNTTWISHESEIFPDVAMRREVLSLYVRCDNHTAGCPWTGELRDLQSHIPECAHLLTGCSYGCGKMMTKDQLQDHLTTCMKRPVICEHCASEVDYAEMTKHQLLKCLKFPVNCTLCGRTGITREEIPQHVDVNAGDCPQAVVPCKYANIGCYTQETRQKICGHYQEYPDTHMQLFLRKLSEYDQKLQTLEEQLKATTKKYADLEVKLLSHTRLLVCQGDQLERQKGDITALQTNQVSGHLYWRLDMSESLADHRSGRPLISPSFYTGFPGYKICLELASYKEGSRYYDSLYVVPQPGEFDDDLYFPFSGVCHVTLYNPMKSEQGEGNHTTSINCNDMTRSYQGDNSMDSRRGRLCYMPSENISDGRFEKNGAIYFDVVFTLERRLPRS